MEHNDKLYSLYLNDINSIHFTPREVDVIACLCSMRGNTKAAALLSVAPSTVITHSKHLMRKIECNSREGVIDFIEKSGTEKYMRAHYFALRQTHLLHELIRSSKKLSQKSQTITIFVGEGNESLRQNLVTLLTETFKQGQLNITFEERVSAKDDDLCSLYLGSREETTKFYTVTANSKLAKICVEILQASFPNSVIRDPINRFLENYQELEIKIHELLGHETLQAPPKRKKGFSFIKKFTTLIRNQNSYSKIGLSLSLVLLIVGGMWMLPDGTNLYSVRSELVLPVQSNLLLRPNLLRAIDETFSHPEAIETTALVGIGGVGKTTLSKIYTQQQTADIVWAVDAETEASINHSFEALADALAQTEEDRVRLKELRGVEKSNVRQRKLLKFVREKFHAHPGWFLLFDNVTDFETIHSFYPRDKEIWGPGRILITTRNKNLENNKRVNHVVEVGELTSGEKLFLFKSIFFANNTNDDTSLYHDKIEWFLEEIPSYPLDISLAAYYLKVTQTNYAEYLDRVFKERFENIKRNLLADTGEYVNTRYSIVILSLEKILDKNDNFVTPLLLLSLVNSREIPRGLLEISSSKKDIDELLYHLKQYSLITEDSPISGTISRLAIHHSTQAIILDYFKAHLSLNDQHPILSSLITKLDGYFQTVLTEENHEEIRLALLHGTQCLTHKELFSSQLGGIFTAKIGALYYHLGDYTKSVKWLHQSLNMLKEYNDKSAMAWALAYLGDSERELGDYTNALTHLEESVFLYESQSPERAKEVAWALTRLGNLHRRAGNLEQARGYLERVVEIYATHAPEAQTQAAWTKTYLANVYNSLGEYKKAKDILENAIEIQKQDFGEDSVRIAWALSFLGDIYMSLGKYEDALNILDQSLSIYEANYGKKHTENARILRSIGQAYTHLNQFTMAERHLLEAYEILKKAEHPELYQPMESLGEVYALKATSAEEAGNVDEAEDLRSRSDSLFRKAEKIHQIHFQ